MNNLFPVFNYQGNQVRTIVENGEPRFIAKDVCDILDLGNVSEAVNRLDDDEKGISSIDTPGGQQEMITVNESGLYSLIFASRKPEAKQFKRLVYHEILPSIRKTGQYGNSKRYFQQLRLETKKMQVQMRADTLKFIESVKDRLTDQALDALINNLTGASRPVHKRGSKATNLLNCSFTDGNGKLTAITPNHKLRQFRMDRNLTQDEMARRLGVQKFKYVRIELGHQMADQGFLATFASVFHLIWADTLNLLAI